MSAQLSILHVTECLIGGISTYLQELLSAQAHTDGQTVTLLAAEEHIPNIPAEALAGVKLITYKRNGRGPAAVIRLMLAVKAACESTTPDIVHLHSSIAGFVGRTPFVCPNSAKLVYSPNGWAFDREDYPRWRNIFGLLERIANRRPATTITCSKHERDVARQYGLDTRHFVTIPHGISSSRAHTPEAISSQPPWKLLFIGRLDYQKGFDRLMLAMTHISPNLANLTVVGDVVFGSKPDGMDQPHISHVGWVQPHEIDSYLDACDLVVMPSRWEGFPFAALEALRRGKPIISSDRGALPEIIDQDQAGCSFPLSEPEALERILKNLSREQLQSMTKAAQQRFAEHYTSDKMNSATMRLYKELAVSR